MKATFEGFTTVKETKDFIAATKKKYGLKGAVYTVLFVELSGDESSQCDALNELVKQFDGADTEIVGELER